MCFLCSFFFTIINTDSSLLKCLNGSADFQFEAAAVNLVAGDKPADVYSEIAERFANLIVLSLCKSLGCCL